MGRVFFKPAAEKDVAHLVHFLFAQSSATASQFHAAVEDTCEQLAESPQLGDSSIRIPRQSRKCGCGEWPASAII
jgi:plasmid stabilization system protein ParE